MKPLVLILCTGNSCRSHLAEGILRAAAGDLIKVASAGSKPAGTNVSVSGENTSPKTSASASMGRFALREIVETK